MDAGRTVECVDFQTGIVRQGEQLGKLRGLNRLLDCIVADCRGVFDDVGESRDVGGGAEIDLELGEDGADFFQFMFVASRDEQLHDGSIITGAENRSFFGR